MKKTEEQKRKKIEVGEAEEDLYTEPGREEMIEEDEVTDVEEGFMKGYEEGEKMAKCVNCNKILEDDMDELVEEEIDGKTYRFCSSQCASRLERKKRYRELT